MRSWGGWQILAAWALAIAFLLVGYNIGLREAEESPAVVDHPAIPDTLDPVEAVIGRLKVQEGLRLRPYRDSKDFLTICYGTRLPLTVAERAHVGVDRDLRDGLTEPECEWLLRGRVRINADAFTGRWRPYELQPFDVQVVLIDAAYQLGPTGLLAFETMLFLLSVGDYDAAAADLLRTKWASDTPARADSAAAVFRRVATDSGAGAPA